MLRTARSTRAAAGGTDSADGSEEVTGGMRGNTGAITWVAEGAAKGAAKGADKGAAKSGAVDAAAGTVKGAATDAVGNVAADADADSTTGTNIGAATARIATGKTTVAAAADAINAAGAMPADVAIALLCAGAPAPTPAAVSGSERHRRGAATSALLGPSSSSLYESLLYASADSSARVAGAGKGDALAATSTEMAGSGAPSGSPASVAHRPSPVTTGSRGTSVTPLSDGSTGCTSLSAVSSRTAPALMPRAPSPSAAGAPLPTPSPPTPASACARTTLRPGAGRFKARMSRLSA